jgi:hypothetical protein
MSLPIPETSEWVRDQQSGLDQISQKLSRKANSPDTVAQELRVAIITGRMKPGERILEFRIARDLGLGQLTVGGGGLPSGSSIPAFAEMTDADTVAFNQSI